MATFLTGNKLNAEIESIIESAQDLIILVSPYIKLHERYSSVLKSKQHHPEVKIIVVFGKNEDDLSKSMIEADFNFFKELPNIHIYYEKRLHAKYIANESASIITSMNFHKYSQDNNIEVGVKTQSSSFISNKLGVGDGDFETEAWNYFSRVIEQADLLFKKEPEYESGFLGITKKYKSSVVNVDKLSDFFNSKVKTNSKENYSEEKISEISGFCIRTGKKIPFDLKQPMTKEAYESWSRFKNKEFKEKYCHFSGEESHGQTTFSKPILGNYWEKAKKTHRF